MGAIKAILKKGYCAGQAMFWEDLRIEKAELIHFHFRDFRFMLTPDQFVTVVRGAKESGRKWDGTLSPVVDVLLDAQKIPGSPINENLIAFEEQESGIIHFHYQDARIEMSPERFLTMARLFNQAAKEYEKTHVVFLPIESIEIYDPGHFETELEWRQYDMRHPDRDDNYDYHYIGIERVKKGLREGKTMRPIAVVKQEDNAKPYRRIDGFKRVIAVMELGEREVPAYIFSDEASPGIQDGQSFFLED